MTSNTGTEGLGTPPACRVIVSVHVPKTAGTSFYKVLQACFGQRLLRDYDDQVMAYGSIARVLRTLSRRRAAAKALQGHDCVHGHFLPLKYALRPRCSLAIWLRDPVERAMSRYHHYLRHPETGSLQFRRYLRRTDLTLEEFVRIPHFQDLYAKYLVGVRLADFDFVGITEQYAVGLELFGRLYGLDCIPPMPKENVNPKARSGRYEVPADVRGLIAAHNRRDCAIYQEALGIHGALVERHLGRTLDVSDPRAGEPVA